MMTSTLQSTLAGHARALRLVTAKARAQRAGVTLQEMQSVIGSSTYSVAKGGLINEFTDLCDLGAFLARLEVEPDSESESRFPQRRPLASKTPPLRGGVL